VSTFADDISKFQASVGIDMQNY